MKRHAAPIIAAILLLLPVLYVGSYLVLVVPQSGKWVYIGFASTSFEYKPYRFGGRYAEKFFWPLEQIDRKVRPGAWEHLDRNAVLMHGEKNGPVYYSP